MAAIEAAWSATLDRPPSCIAFCPTRPHFCVVGTYYLHPRESEETVLSNKTAGSEEASPANETPQKRSGSLIVCSVSEDSITQVSTLTTDFAILDIQWSRQPDELGHLLAVATSTGLLAFYRLDDTTPQLTLSCVTQVCDPSILVLSLAWHPTRPNVLGLTLSNGHVLVCASTAGNAWSHTADFALHEIHRHELEAWTVAFAPTSALVLSGGDDMILQCSQIEDFENAASVWQDRRLHQAGVTAILPLSDTLVVTGSYDDHIRLLSLPSVGRKRELASLNLGGGVWRLKLLETDQSVVVPNNSNAALPHPQSIIILASCMHAGTRIVRVAQDRSQEGAWGFEILAKFEDHKSMNYASDVQPHEGGSSSRSRRKTIVSTSFYDKLICLWQFGVETIAS